MPLRSLIFSFIILTFYSCSSVSINKLVEVNAEEDWLYIGGDPAKTNISRSKNLLEPPFNLYWEFDADGGLAKNCLSASDAILFANTLNGEFYAVDITTGKSIGRTSTLGKSSYSTPVIVGNNIVITSTGDKTSRIFGYDLGKGKSNWQRNISWIESSPVLVNEDVVVAGLNGKIYKLNALNGNIIWSTKPSKLNSVNNSFYTSPTVSGNIVLAGNIDGNMYAYELSSGKELWKFKTDASIFSDASAWKGNIYFGSDDKNFYCIDTSGTLVWKKDLKTKFLSSPTFYNDNVIVSAIDGNVYSLETADGDLKWTSVTKGAIWASPLLHKDKIFVGSFDRNFYCLNAEDGKQLWKYGCEGRIKTSAIIWKDYIFVASDEKYIYCFSNSERPKSTGGSGE
ncbi:MAG: PQQ-binding-like beta-propeller repeat protein [bacterium]|nr:PQQ-binding-like beta-propeller repeat protein [bacterium]